MSWFWSIKSSKLIFFSKLPVAVILSTVWKMNLGSLLIIHAKSSIALKKITKNYLRKKCNYCNKNYLVKLVVCNFVILQCWYESKFGLFLKKTNVKVSYTIKCSLLNCFVVIIFCAQNFSTSSKFVSGIFVDTLTAEILILSIFSNDILIVWNS